MIRTLDDKILKRGDYAYEIGVELNTGLRRPVRGKVHGRGTDRLHNHINCYASYHECLNECYRRNVKTNEA